MKLLPPSLPRLVPTFRPRPGFTLVELIAVICVCTIFIVLLLPGLARHGHHADAATAPADVDRNWKTSPAIVQVNNAPAIYAVGDFHADYDKAVKILTAAGLLKNAPAKPEDAKWAGSTAVLVCTGDMIDKGPQGVEVVRMMRALQADAASAGGQVIVTLGNHEAEFLGADGTNKKSAQFTDQLRQAGLDATLVAAGKDDQGLGAWLRGLPAGARVNGWFFSHAGNTHGQSVDQLESAVEDGVGKQGFAAPILGDDDSILEARMHPTPWWGGQQPAGLAKLQANAAALGCKHLVAGHQPGVVKFGDHIERPKDETFAYEGTLFLIDDGMSRGVDDGKPTVLKITPGTHETAQVIDPTGAQTLLWDANVPATPAPAEKPAHAGHKNK